jgi:peptidoglycan/LPS O-acetylase OafA/YrhL
MQIVESRTGMSTIDEQGQAIPRAPGRFVDFFRNWSTSRTTYPLGYVPALDGSRGLMTLGVLTAHTRMALFGGAMVYMDVFFAMSGYLITSLLIAEHGKHGSIDLKKFYVRRLRRLYPALIAMLAVLVAVSAVLSSDFHLRLTEAAVTFTYLSDYWRAFDGIGIYYTGHTWSLAVEEQFYLLWPVAFIFLIRRYGVSWAAVSIVFAAAAGFALWRIWLIPSFKDHDSC